MDNRVREGLFPEASFLPTKICRVFIDDRNGLCYSPRDGPLAQPDRARLS
jgi:hypothetical protein